MRKNQSVILIVDDSFTNVTYLSMLLKDDYIIKVASNGVIALELAHTNPIPDLILLDIEMPDMNGYEVIENLKKDYKTSNIPVIFITAKNNIKDEEIGFELGVVDYISKPIHAPIVKARVKTHIKLKEKQDLLIKMANYDQLTNLYNRHYLSALLSKKVEQSYINNQTFSIIILDIDHFKSINDTFGHLAGDMVLKLVADLILKFSDESNIVARFGGEEFIIVLDNCTEAEAFIKAENIRIQISLLIPEGILVTSSFGVAQYNQFINRYEDLIENADKALYCAKKDGRNRVISYSHYRSKELNTVY